MSHETLIPNLVNAIERLNAAGDSWGWPGEQIARIAIRRWDSYSRRHRKAKPATDDERVLDLAKGLQAHFEPDIPYTPKSDWRAFAEALAQVLRPGAE
jgi:hypothetical protein